MPDAVIAARRFAIPSLDIMALSRAAETAILAGANSVAANMTAELLAVLRTEASQRWVADALEMASLVLEAQCDAKAATEGLHTADAIRTASGEQTGGTRALAHAVQQGRLRLGNLAASPPR